jgi:hypothetical protein
MAPSARVGVLYAATLDRLTRFAGAVWRSLEDHGRRRADRELLALANRWQDANPTLARELRSHARGGSSF